ncbi:MAG: DegT/DnrJ/EryC1/StrS aminotransferase family protein, partial [Bacteroidales bacterium]|nr:DegT/DnrJ/EryC1/StrS aminotransferase family protein [Bacteroidales bacterium]
PLHRQEAFRTIARTRSDLEVSDMLASQVLSLPMHTELSEKEQDRIIEAIKQFFEQNQTGQN